jgi:hypothetical protein
MGRYNESLSCKVRALIRVPAKMLACERSITKHVHRDLVDNIDETVLIMLKLRDDPEGQNMARYLQWILLKTELNN